MPAQKRNEEHSSEEELVFKAQKAVGGKRTHSYTPKSAGLIQIDYES